ncbi:MAG: DTW domain-containing protein [Oligoflexia bacterium]|nr:DTW domain-containing protein [Oligoflexia bacterium]
MKSKNIYSKILRCQKCFLHKPLCICEDIQRLLYANKIKFHFVIHRKEWITTSNTARIVAMTLSNKEIYTFADGNPHEHLDLNKLPNDPNKTVIMFPLTGLEIDVDVDKKNLSENAKINTENITDIIVPDGNWNNTKRMAKKLHIAIKAPFITLKSDRLSKYRLRKQPDLKFLSTFEAVVQAIKFFEEDVSKSHIENLFDLFDKFVDRSLWVNGRILEQDLKYPLDKTAKQFFPNKIIHL